MKEALKFLSDLVAEGVIEAYAIGGAMGATFYLEPVAARHGLTCPTQRI